MSIMLGDLTTKQIEQRLQITLTDDERRSLEDMRQDSAQSIENGKWHCFDIPFTILCGDKDTAFKVRDILSPYASAMKDRIQIAVGR